MPRGRGFRECENWENQGAPGQSLSMLFHCTPGWSYLAHHSNCHLSNRSVPSATNEETRGTEQELGLGSLQRGPMAVASSSISAEILQ